MCYGTVTGSKGVEPPKDLPLYKATTPQEYRVLIFFSRVSRYSLYDDKGGLLVNNAPFNKCHTVSQKIWEDGEDPTKEQRFYASILDPSKYKKKKKEQNKSVGGNKKKVVENIKMEEDKRVFDKTIFMDCGFVQRDMQQLVCSTGDMLKYLEFALIKLKHFFDIQSAWGCYGKPVKITIGAEEAVSPMLFALSSIIRKRSDAAAEFGTDFMEKAITKFDNTFKYYLGANWSIEVEYRFITQDKLTEIDFPETPPLLKEYMDFEDAVMRIDEHYMRVTSVQAYGGGNMTLMQGDEKNHPLEYRGYTEVRGAIYSREECYARCRQLWKMKDPFIMMYWDNQQEQKRKQRNKEILDSMLDDEQLAKQELEEAEDEYYKLNINYVKALKKNGVLRIDLEELQDQIFAQKANDESEYAQAYNQSATLRAAEGEQINDRALGDYQGEWMTYDEAQDKWNGSIIEDSKNWRDLQSARKKVANGYNELAHQTWKKEWAIWREAIGLGSIAISPLSAIDICFEIYEVCAFADYDPVHIINIGADLVGVIPAAGAVGKAAIKGTKAVGRAAVNTGKAISGTVLSAKISYTAAKANSRNAYDTVMKLISRGQPEELWQKTMRQPYNNEILKGIVENLNNCMMNGKGIKDAMEAAKNRLSGLRTKVKKIGQEKAHNDVIRYTQELSKTDDIINNSKAAQRFLEQNDEAFEALYKEAMNIADLEEKWFANANKYYKQKNELFTFFKNAYEAEAKREVKQKIWSGVSSGLSSGISNAGEFLKAVAQGSLIKLRDTVTLKSILDIKRGWQFCFWWEGKVGEVMLNAKLGLDTFSTIWTTYGIGQNSYFIYHGFTDRDLDAEYKLVLKENADFLKANISSPIQ